MLSSAPSLTLRLFGRPDIFIDGRPMSPTRTRKGISLLAILALRGGRPIERSYLASLLWPDSPDTQGLYNLRRSLSDLRECLGPAAERLTTPSPRALALNLAGVDADVARFDRAVEQGEAEEALALYRGPLLEGCLEEWVGTERDDREQAFLRIVEHAAARALENGSPGLAERYWRRVLGVDPLRESALCGLLRALRASGDYAAATEAYRDFRSVLRRELNTEPAASTTQLYEEIRACAGSALVGEPSRKGSVAWVGRRPPEGWALFGREEAVEQVLGAFASHRVVVVTGPGGVGKTSLSLRVAHQWGGRLAERLAFVDLSHLAAAEPVAPAVAQALEVHPLPGETAEAALARELASRPLMLILDNCEHVDTRAAELMSNLLRRCGELRILATSRHVLAAAGAAHLALAPLPVPNGKTPTPVSDFPSARLFADRARRVQPSFELNDGCSEAVGRICARLDGMPLAIELAAARVRGMTPVQIADRLDALLPRLEGAPFPLAERHLSLRAVTDWSYDLLPEAQQVLLRRLSIFSGGCTLEAAEAVCGEPPLEGDGVLDLLLRLLDRSLLQYEESAGEGRYVLLETIRHYARERLRDSGEEGAVGARHRSFFLSMADEAEARLLGPDELKWLHQLDREYPNLRAALHEAPVGERLRMAGGLWRYWLDRGMLAEGSERICEALAEVDTVSIDTARARMGAGGLALFQGRYEESERAFMAAREEYRKLGSPLKVATATHNLGRLELERGRYERARPLFEEALAAYEELGDRTGQAFALGNLASIAVAAGELDVAEALLARNEQLLRLQGLYQTLGGTLHERALMAARRGEWEAARELLGEALEIHERFGHRLNAARARTTLAAVSTARGDVAGADEHLAEAVTEWGDLGNPQGMIQALWCFAHLSAAREDFRRAARLLGAWEELHREHAAPLIPGFEPVHGDLVCKLESSLGAETFARLRRELVGLPVEHILSETARLA